MFWVNLFFSSHKDVDIHSHKDVDIHGLSTVEPHVVTIGFFFSNIGV